MRFFAHLDGFLRSLKKEYLRLNGIDQPKGQDHRR